MMNELFVKRFKEYFGDYYDDFIKVINEPSSKALYLNAEKGDPELIIKEIDFPLVQTGFNDLSRCYEYDGIGHHPSYELGLVYPQEPSAAFTASFANTDNIRLCVDMCAAPGGKSINIKHRLPGDCLLVSNEINYKRATILSQNLERCGINDNVIITNKDGKGLAKQFKNLADLVILDAPCSGEGMIRKYQEIIDDYSLEKINECAKIQKELLENAYEMLKKGGELLYSTCTYAFEEDEEQILSFLMTHQDIKLVELPFSGINPSRLQGTIKLSPLNKTEGQFIALLKKDGELAVSSYKYEKSIANKLADDFIKENLAIDDYYLYLLDDTYYLSLLPLLKIDRNVLKYGIEVGKITKGRFEPSHGFYRSNILAKLFKRSIELNAKDYHDYVAGLELPFDVENGYYLVKYHGYSVGFGKCTGGRLKNKYPKGLRQVYNSYKGE